MSKLSIIGSAGKGEADYSTEGAAGSSYTYFPMPGGGYGYEYAMYQGKKIIAYPIIVIFADTDTVLAVYYSPIPTPTPIPPPPQGERMVESVGVSCAIYERYLFGRNWFYLRHNVTGALTSMDSELNDIRDRSKDFALCNVPVKTPDSVFDELNQKLSSGLSSLSKAVDGVIFAMTDKISTVEGEISRINKSLFDIGRFVGSIDDWFAVKFDSMKDTVIEWISNAFIDILEKVLNREVKL